MQVMEQTKSADHLDRQPTLCLLWVFVKLHITTLNRSVLIPVDSSAEDGQECLADGSDKNLTIN